MDLNHKLHIAFIVDGNGRWAKARNMPRTYGHQAGVKRLQELITGLKNNPEIGVLSFYLFSLENWKRDPKEIEFLFKYLDDYVKFHQQEFIDSNLKFFWTGFTDKLPPFIINDLQSLVNKTKDHTGTVINFVFNYGGMQDIVQACNQIQKLDHEVDMIEFSSYLLTKNLPAVDLMIRTSGEQRISNFLLYQMAYAEFIFEPTKFPDYTLDIFYQNLAEFKTRDIRKGGYGNASKK